MDRGDFLVAFLEEATLRQKTCSHGAKDDAYRCTSCIIDLAVDELMDAAEEIQLAYESLARLERTIGSTLPVPIPKGEGLTTQPKA